MLPYATAISACAVLVALIARDATTALAVEVPTVLLLASNLGFERRSAGALAADALQGAALLRASCVIGALGLLLASLLSLRGRLRPPVTLGFYLGYGLVAALASLGALAQGLAGYRALEIVTVGLLGLSAWATGGRKAGMRLLDITYWWVVGLVTVIWINVLLFPSQAIETLDSPIRWQIQGLYPAVASNGVGTLGLLLLVWNLSLLLIPNRLRSPRSAVFFALVGLITLVFSQYRTGFIALLVVLAFLLFVGRQTLLALLISIAVVAILIGTSATSAVSSAEPVLLRGDNLARAEQLSGRRTYWELALPVWRESPIIGRGLGSGSRLEVLGPNGFQDTSNLHSTWVEALVGTGLLGVCLLAMCYLGAIRGAIRVLHLERNAIPISLLIAIGVRSLTGVSIESLGVASMILVGICLLGTSAGQPSPRR
jgi:O-antigen ligase